MPTINGYAAYTNTDRIITFGNGGDIHLSDKANTTTNSYTNPGVGYLAPPGLGQGTNAAYVYLHQSSPNQYFTPAEIETYLVYPQSQGTV